jgi:hypothetical protein
VTTVESMSSTELSDWIEIANCQARYTAAVDRHDWDLLDTVFTPDAPCDYFDIAGFRGTATELKAWLSAHMPPPGGYYHLLGAARVEITGDTAVVITPCLNPMPFGGTAPVLLGHWYRDSMLRTDGGWRITERFFEVAWQFAPPNDAATLALVAKQEITEALHRYCHSVDRYDRETLLAVWHPDGTADYGDELYQGSAGGLVDWLWATHASTLARSHQVTNILIELDGDTARSESYVTVALRFPDPDGIADTDTDPDGGTEGHADAVGAGDHVGGDRREGDSHGDGVQSVARARYSDTWSRRDGRWAIDHRRLVIDMSNSSS